MDRKAVIVENRPPVFYQAQFTSRPPISSPVSAPGASGSGAIPGPGLGPAPGPGPHQQHPPNLPGVSSLSASHNHPYGPPPPPPLHHSVPPPPPPQQHGEAPERGDHAYNAPHSGQNTPIIRHHPDGPYQRTPSTPSLPAPPHSQAPPPPPPDRHSMDAAIPPPSLPPAGYHHQQAPPRGPPESHAVGYAQVPHMIEHSPYPHPGYGPPQPYSLYPPPMHLTNGQSRKKSMRASQACDKCRERKSKCDEARPCATCKENNIECHYKDSQPTKIDKSNAVFADSINKVLEQLSHLTDRMASLERAVQAPSSFSEPSHLPGPRAAAPKLEQLSASTSRNDTPALDDAEDAEFQVLPAPEVIDRTDEDRPMDFEDHTTAAHKLLMLWPSIHKLIKHNAPNKNYVMIQEDRGPLRLYGRGERAFEDSVAIGAASPANSTGSGDIGVSPSDHGSMHDHEPKRSGFHNGHSIETPMDMRSSTLSRLFENYKIHIHRLHPFLDIDTFQRYIRLFIQRHSIDGGKGSTHSPGFATNGLNERTSLKRKRSDGLSSGFPAGPEVTSQAVMGPKGPPERSLINAIVYLVFALGKVCEADNPIPGPVQEHSRGDHVRSYPGASPSTTTARLSSASPVATSTAFTPPAGGTFQFDSQRSPFEGSHNTVERKSPQNIDRIPGLTYYREACSILGDFADSNELACAQARLLAGLYKGQLVRTQESWSWIHFASRTCLYRLRLEGLHKKIPRQHVDRKKNLTLLAYWTCLQLESDILAELDYPYSGLSSHENHVNWPNNIVDAEAGSKIVTETATDLDMINIYYTAQLFLRRTLNNIHSQLYATDLNRYDPQTLANRLHDYDETLSGWRNINHQMTLWDDDEEPHHEILAARLRAKYYGARYVSTRPFLDYALHVMDEISAGRDLREVTKDAHGVDRENEFALFQAISQMPPELVREKAKICVECAISSTVALDGVATHRLIVTNIMGTAHAQFGNMLVLAAVHASQKPWLQALIPEKKLKWLMARTIKFLRNLQYASHTACVDISILEGISNNMFKDDIHRNEMHTGESYSSSSV